MTTGIGNIGVEDGGWNDRPNNKYIEPSVNEKSEDPLWQRVCNSFYEISAPIISIVDVVTDMLVAYQFYQNGRMVFFWISVSIFILAQFCYTMLFMLYYTEHRRSRARMIIFVCVFPFGQFVPLFMWLDSFRLQKVTAFLACLDFDTNAFQPRYRPPDMDPLQFWIEQKFRSQGGFIIESVIEAFPQSIMQMIAILLVQEATPLTVFSILFSMTSVASKALILSYSIDRITFLFNFLCFTADVFGIFSTISWVFFHPQDQSTKITFLGEVWIWKVAILAASIFLAGFTVILGNMLMECVRYCQNYGSCYTCQACRQRCWFCICHCGEWFGTCMRNVFSGLCDPHDPDMPLRRRICRRISIVFVVFAILLYMILIFTAGVFLFCVFVMVVEIAKLSIIPMVFHNLDPGHRHAAPFFRELFDWLDTAPNRFDRQLRLAVINHVTGYMYIRTQTNLQQRKDILANPYYTFLNWILQPKFDPLMLQRWNNQEAARQQGQQQQYQQLIIQPSLPQPPPPPPSTFDDGIMLTASNPASVQKTDSTKEESQINAENTNEGITQEIKNVNARMNYDRDDGSWAIKSNIEDQKQPESDQNNPTAQTVNNVKDPPLPPKDFSSTLPIFQSNVTESDVFWVGYMHLFAVRAKDIRHFGNLSLRYFIKQYLGCLKQAYNQDLRHKWTSGNCCAKILLSIVIFMLFFAVYVAFPCLCIYLVGSMLYPLLCLAITPWHDVELLQLTLTLVYASMFIILAALAPHVYRFEYNNYHMVVIRKYFYRPADKSVMQTIRKQYTSLIATKTRNKLIRQFFGDLTDTMMQFVSELHEVDDYMNEKALCLDHEPSIDERLFDLKNIQVNEDLLGEITEEGANYHILND